jgi:hypothetical protein
MSQALDDLLSIAERAYVRMQAGELISQCLDQGDQAPLDNLVQQLVLAGAPSLSILREILDEIRSTRSTLRQEGLALRQDLKEALAGFGVHLPKLLSADPPEAFRRICGQGLREEIREAARELTAEDQAVLDEICVDASGRVAKIAARLALLGHLDSSVRDWLASLAYEAARANRGPESPEPTIRMH